MESFDKESEMIYFMLKRTTLALKRKIDRGSKRSWKATSQPIEIAQAQADGGLS